MSRGTLWAGLVVLFGAGILCGVAGSWFYHSYEQERRGERGPAAQHERLMKRLTHELSLTPAQQADIEPLVTRAHVAILELRFAHQAEVEDILTRGVADLKGKLSAEQQVRLDGMYGQLQQRWQKSRDYLDRAKKRLAWLRSFSRRS
ncbi:MAG: hypothetical protein H8K03_19310 [Nitrospira sp.]